jgi:N-acetylmuramoyl-L-alanine amidase
MFVLLFLFSGESQALTIAVDPGHGGKDPGAVGVNGLYEKTVNLDIALKLKNELEKHNLKVVMTREQDVYISLQDRVHFAKQHKADLFVSIHANAHPSSKANGTLVLYYDNRYPQAAYPASAEMARLTPESRRLAVSVLESVVAETGTANLGIVPSSVYVVRMGQAPSILVEAAFLSNRQDAEKLANPQVRQKFAKGITQGILNYINTHAGFTDISGHWALDAVLRLKEQGLVGGVGGRFEPGRPLTRAELVAFLSRLFPEAFAGRAQAENSFSFSDVLPQHWAYTLLQKASEAGYLKGYPDGTLRPDQPVTRAEASAVFVRLAGWQPGTVSEPTERFSDVPLGAWYAKAVYALKETGILRGKTERQFFPHDIMLRGEIAVMMDRYLTYKQTAEPSAGAADPAEQAADVPADPSASDSSEHAAEPSYGKPTDPSADQRDEQSDEQFNEQSSESMDPSADSTDSTGQPAEQPADPSAVAG